MNAFYKLGTKYYLALWFSTEKVTSIRKITVKFGYRITLVKDSQYKCWLLLVTNKQDKEVLAKRLFK